MSPDDIDAAISDIPRTGPDLLAWIEQQPNAVGVRALAHRRGRSRGWPLSIRDWTERQVAVSYRELVKQLTPEAGGIFRWGGAAESGHRPPK